MPILSQQRKSEIAAMFMDKRKDMYRAAPHQDAFETLIEQLYRRGFTLNSQGHKHIVNTASELGITVIEASDFFKEIVVTMADKIVKASRGIRH